MQKLRRSPQPPLQAKKRKESGCVLGRSGRRLVFDVRFRQGVSCMGSCYAHGRKTMIGIFIGLLLLITVTGELIWPALAALVATVLCGYMTGGDIIAKSWVRRPSFRLSPSWSFARP